MPRDKSKFRLWVGIMKHKVQFFKFIEFVVGDARKIRFWEECWCAP